MAALFFREVDRHSKDGGGREHLTAELRYVTNFTFTHDTLMWLVGTFNLIHMLAVSFWQFSCDDVCPSWNVQAKGTSNRH